MPIDQLDWIRSRFHRCVEVVCDSSRTPHDIRVAIVDDARMRELHEQYKRDGSTTDVLTFDLRSDPGEALDVDLVVCLDEARRQAADRGHDMTHELLLYSLHGLLHCVGYDDRDEEAARAMHRREDELLREVGVGSVYGISRGDGVSS
ncbi:MAG: rRNA maturation RNase YbeY [Phycisphaerales bacterium JB043]